MREIIEKSISIHADALGLKKITSITLRELGSGESNTNILATINNSHTYVFRMPLNAQSAGRITQEYQILSHLPAGIGPTVFYFDDSRKLCGYPYFVEEFIDGEVPTKYNTAFLQHFAHTLALLHSIKSSRASVGGQFVEHINIKQFSDKHNEPLKNGITSDAHIKILKHLEKSSAEFFRKHQKLMDSVTSYSLTHGDLSAGNMLTVEDGSVRMIDWEYAGYTDNARDFAGFYYDNCSYNSGKWRVQLMPEEEEILLGTYLKTLRDDNLLERIRVWQQIDKMSSAMYMMYKLDNFNHELATLSRPQLTEQRDMLLSAINFV